MHENRRSAKNIAWVCALGLMVSWASASEARSKKILYSFGSSVFDGAGPGAGVIADANGVLYGTTEFGGDFGQGTVFSLTPLTTAGGSWTEAVLHSFSFGAFGTTSVAPLLLGKNGVLYGTATGGVSGNGFVFALTPPSVPGGVWTEAELYSFRGGDDGIQPMAGLVAGPDGTLYGTTGEGINDGTVFALAPPAIPGGTWTETVLHVFGSVNPDGAVPRGRLLLGKDGTLYGTTSTGTAQSFGLVYSLSPPATKGGTWTETILHAFSGLDGSAPLAGLVAGKNGILYGTTSEGGSLGSGNMYSLTPPSSPGGTWTETVIHSFRFDTDGFLPSGEVVLTRNGSILGTTAGVSYLNPFFHGFDGTLYTLKPPAIAGGAWSEMVLAFRGSPSDGAAPLSTLVIGKGGALFGTTWAGGMHGSGTVFEVTP